MYNNTPRTSMAQWPQPNRHNSAVSRIASDLATLRAQQPQLAGQLARWCTQRRETIRIVEDLLEKLQGVSTCADVARGVGGAVVIAGAFASLVGALMEMNKSENAKSWQEAGDSLRSLGEIAVPGVNLLELGISEMFLREVRETLQRDQELSRPINQWLQLTRDLDRRVMQTFGVSLTSSAFSQVLSSFGRSVEMICSGQTNAAYNTVRRGAGSNAPRLLSALTNGKGGGAVLGEIARAIEQAATALDDSPGLRRVCSNGVGLGVALSGYGGRSLDLNVLDGSMRMAGFDPGVRRCGLEAARMAKEVVSVMQAVESVQNGSQSEYCKSVEEVLDVLREEFRAVSREVDSDDWD